MQIVGGTKKGLKLSSVPGDSTRPILDRVKTALFDMIRDEIQDKTFLDLFAGSGSVGLEALSQGAKHITFLDINNNAINTLKSNTTKAGFNNQAKILQKDSFRFLTTNTSAFDIIFVAPPQYKGLWEKAMNIIDEQINILNPTLIIVQIDPKEYKDFQFKNIQETKQKKYGNTVLVFYEKKPFII